MTCPECTGSVNLNVKFKDVCCKCGQNTDVFKCSSGHMFCGSCIDEMSLNQIKEICVNSTSSDPFVIMNDIFDSDLLRFHDFKHHAAVGCALIAAHRNSGFELDISPLLDEMVKRGRKVPPGSCGLMGNCGAAVSIGTFYSVMTGTTPYSEKTWSDANLATAQSLIEMAIVGGPRCCKRNSMIALRVGTRIAIEKLGSQMVLGEMHCDKSEKNKECIKERCPFYKG